MTCTLHIFALFVLALLAIVLINSSSISTYVNLGNDTGNLEVVKNRPCMCVPYERINPRSVVDWGVPVTCPPTTVLKDARFWCTSDSPTCVDAICDQYL